MTDAQSKELTNLVAAVFDAQMSGICQFINGSREFNETEWQAFIEEMDGLGLSRLEEIQLEAFQSMYA